jgi:hypothetical protein
MMSVISHYDSNPPAFTCPGECVHRHGTFQKGNTGTAHPSTLNSDKDLDIKRRWIHGFHKQTVSLYCINKKGSVHINVTLTHIPGTHVAVEKQ